MYLNRVARLRMSQRLHLVLSNGSKLIAARDFPERGVALGDDVTEQFKGFGTLKAMIRSGTVHAVPPRMSVADYKAMYQPFKGLPTPPPEEPEEEPEEPSGVLSLDDITEDTPFREIQKALKDAGITAPPGSNKAALLLIVEAHRAG